MTPAQLRAYWRTHHIMSRRQQPDAAACVVIVGDLHCGSTLGLCPPKCKRDGGGPIELSAGQEWLWANWLDFERRAYHAARGRALYVVCNGDLVDGTNHETTQLVTSNIKDQRRMAVKALEPLRKRAAHLFVIRGTGAHVGAASQDDDAVGERLKATPTPEGDFAWWELRASFGDVLFDISHHIGGTARPWTAGGPAVRLAAQVVMLAAGAGEPVPQLVIRSHVHRYHDSFSNVPGCRALTCPAWQLRTEYGYRIAAAPADIGGIIARCKGGVVESLEVVRYEIKQAPPWHDTPGRADVYAG
jgi:hypothetical protein